VLGESPCALPPELAEVYFFAETVARGSGEEDHWREAIMRRYGEVGIIELAQAISIARLFPTVMHVMGCAGLLMRHSTGRATGRIADRQAPRPPVPNLGRSHRTPTKTIRGRSNNERCSASDDRRIGLRIVLSQPSAPQTLSAVCKNRHRSSGCLRDSLSSSIAG
jgi:hypothetical protein